MSTPTKKDYAVSLAEAYKSTFGLKTDFFNQKNVKQGMLVPCKSDLSL